jgi:hypothetical protein
MRIILQFNKFVSQIFKTSESTTNHPHSFFHLREVDLFASTLAQV